MEAQKLEVKADYDTLMDWCRKANISLLISVLLVFIFNDVL